MLPRRHILDISYLVDDERTLLSMATLSLAIDAVKYMHNKPKKDHLVEALELNEFICFMFPAERPKNRSLFCHIVSDLLGLLMYGVPRAHRYVVENLETVNYSEESMETYPVIELWNALKAKVYKKKHGDDVIEGFIKKIRIEMDTVERFPFVEDVFQESKKCLAEWLPSFAGYYDESKKKVQNCYERWWTPWLCGQDKDMVLNSLLDRLAVQAKDDFDITIEKDQLFTSIKTDKALNRQENELFSRWYKEGMNLLLKI
ncbi:MAG TPA: hypothetical protein VMT62_13285 [Syntrophorhabdaceae bacterium]|nr:hypothetical protein [Syntrophorhabdaceae bacterium]